MKVAEIMTRRPITVSPDTPLKELIERMMGADVRSLPVTDAAGHLLGLLTEADLVSKEAYGTVRHRHLAMLADVISGREHHWVAKAAGAVAADCMTEKVVTCSAEDDVRVAARRMLEHGIKHLPVLDGARLIGIVTARDILRVFDRPDRDIAADVGATLTGNSCLPDDHHVRFSVADGVVTLVGDVRYGWDEPVVVSIVQGVPGVIDVVSELHHREPNPASVPGGGLGPW
jgi:CBS domain-containing protein